MSRIPRNKPVGPMPQPDPVRLIAPGLAAPADPYSAGAAKALALAGALGLAGNLGQEISQSVRRDRANRERQKGELRGLGIQHLQERLPILKDEIAQGKRPVPEGVKFEDFAEAIIGEESSGFDPFSVEGARDFAKPHLIDALVDRQRKEKTAATEESLTLLSESFATAASADEMNALIGHRRGDFAEVSDTEFLSGVTMPALKRAAAAGDADRVAMIESVLGDRFPVERSEARGILKRAERAFEAEQQAAFVEDITKRLNDRLLRGVGTFDAINDRIDSYRKAGQIDEKSANQMLTTVREQRNAAEGEAKTALRRAEVETAHAGAVQDAVAHLLASQTTGGAPTIKPFEFEDSGKVKHKWTPEQLGRAATDLLFAAIDKTAAKPEEAARAKVQFLSDTGAGYEPWTEVLNGSVAQVNTESIARTLEDGKTPAIPAAINQGIALWESMHWSPQLRDRLTTNEDARQFYTGIQLAKRLTGNDNPRAIMLSIKALKTKGPPSPLRASIDELQTKVDSFAADALNKSDIARDVDQMADFAMRIGYGPDEAIAEAARIVDQETTTIGKWAVRTTGMHVPEYLPRIVTIVASQYSVKHPEEKGEHLTLLPQGDGAWVLFDTRTRLPVENWQTDGLFTADELHDVYLKHQRNKTFQRAQPPTQEDRMDRLLNRRAPFGSQDFR